MINSWGKDTKLLPFYSPIDDFSPNRNHTYCIVLQIHTRIVTLFLQISTLWIVLDRIFMKKLFSHDLISY